jgi:hypothetical protein
VAGCAFEECCGKDVSPASKIQISWQQQMLHKNITEMVP